MLTDADPIVKHINFLEEQKEHFARRASKYAPGTREENVNRNEFYCGIVTRHEAIIEYLRNKVGQTASATPSETSSARERRAALGDLSDLPKELLAQLSVQRGDQLEDDILDVIESNGGTANVDQILIDLYRKTKKIHERRFIPNKLYRMGKAGAVYAIPKKRGVYSLDAPDGSHTESDLFDEMTEAQPS
jgi:hypothetical protein